MSTESNSAAATETASVIDTSKMSSGQKAALELTESARDGGDASHAFAGGLFMGRCDIHAMHPWPQPEPGEKARGDAFLAELEVFLRAHVNPDQIDADGEVPPEVFAGLAKLKAFAIKIPRQYGGLGLSQTNYCRVGMLLGSYCSNLTALVSAHQSIGVPQPLLMFGTEAQKAEFLPRFAKGEVSAFALTEKGVGSDPAKMETTAAPTADGAHFLINGEKVWCTNGLKAGVIVVMAKTPALPGDAPEKTRITAFIVDMKTPGIEIKHRCHFMGLKALYNGVIHFHNVKVPRANILLAEGKGLKVALSTLNTGRLTLPAACTGFSKKCLAISRAWSHDRVQWGCAIGKHGAIADKIARMAAETFAMEAMTFYTAAQVDKDKNSDIRIEAAMCKMWAAERAWEHVNEALQIRGGRGYETAQSLAARGEEPWALERMLRDCRINLIFEGSSEIMRLFIAREALDTHLKLGAPAMDSRKAFKDRARSALTAAKFYARWYPGLLLGGAAHGGPRHGQLAPLVAYASHTAARLARVMFHAMVKHGPKLERQQILLARFVDIGTELFALCAACAYAQSLNTPEAVNLADHFGQRAKLKIDVLFAGVSHNADRAGHQLAQSVIAGDCAWLEDGTIK